MALFGRSYDGSRFTFSSAPKLHGTAARMTFSAQPWKSVNLTIAGVSLDAEGETYELLRAAKSAFERFPKEAKVGSLDLRYRHPLVGEVKLESVALRASDPNWVFSIGTAQIGTRRFRNAVVGVFERQDFFVFSLGAETLKDARFQLAQYGSPLRGSIWNLHIAHQGLTELLDALDWRVAGLEDTKVVGQLTLLTSPRDNDVRGSLQLTFDRFPQPSLPESEALFGHSASLFFRLVRHGAAGFDFDAPYVEANSSLFTLKGSGKVSLFGDRSSLLFDVTGQSPCTVLAAQLPPSQYRSRVESRPRDPSPSAGLPLRVQLRAASTAEVPEVALALEAGCGIEGASVGTFRSLSLPPFQPQSRPPAPSAP
jgi:hypothetical protein